MPATKTCAHCGIVYARNRSFGREQWATSRFCSRQCYGKTITGISTGPKPEIRIGKEIECVECGKTFYAEPWKIKRRPGQNKFCSKECTYKGRELKATFVKGHSDLVPQEARKRAGAKTSVSLTGRQLSAEHKAKMSNARRGVKLSQEHIRKSLMRRPMSSLEVRMAGLIAEQMLPYRFVGNGEFFVGRKNPDFIHSEGRQIAVEVFYRRHKEKFAGGLDRWRRDREDVFTSHGWKIIFLDESQVTSEKVRIALGGV